MRAREAGQKASQRDSERERGGGELGNGRRVLGVGGGGGGGGGVGAATSALRLYSTQSITEYFL